MVKLEIYEQAEEYHANLAFRDDPKYQHYNVLFKIVDEKDDVNKVKKAAISWCRRNGINQVFNLFNDNEPRNCLNCRNLCKECVCYD